MREPAETGFKISSEKTFLNFVKFQMYLTTIRRKIQKKKTVFTLFCFDSLVFRLESDLKTLKFTKKDNAKFVQSYSIGDTVR